LTQPLSKDKDPRHESGRLYCTSHRVVYLDQAKPLTNSCHLPLGLIRQTEYWAGFLKSSPKITLLLGPAPGDAILPKDPRKEPVAAVSWVCRVCGFSNASSTSCSLCGVKRSEASTPSSTPSRSSTPAPAPPPTEQHDGLACPVCTFINHPSLSSCEMCGSKLGTASLSLSDRTGRSSRAGTPEPSVAGLPSEQDFVRLSFRKGGEKAFYAALKKALLAKAWEDVSPAASAALTERSIGISESSGVSLCRSSSRADGILQTIDTHAQGRSAEMQDALSDLQSLMARAKDMVELARHMNAKLPQDEANDSGAKLVRSTMATLGLPAPVTSDMVKDEQQYHQELAIELAGLLTGSALTRGANPNMKEPLMTDDGQGRGLMVLDEVWCIWNRARGVCTCSQPLPTNDADVVRAAMVSPTDFREACSYLPIYTWPSIELRTFASGLTVLHTKRFKEAAFQVRISTLLQSHAQSGISTIDIARREKLPVGLTLEMLEGVERKSGAFARDDKAADGVRFFPNLILDFVWADPN
jgi:ESCRT-II complex subunit VPS36